MRRSLLRSTAIIASLMLIGYGVAVTQDRADPRWLVLLVVIAGLWAVALWPSRPLAPGAQVILHLALVFAVGFGLVTVQVLRAHLVDRDRILAKASDPASGVIDLRRVLAERRIERGRILLRDGTVLASDAVDSSGTRVRVYHEQYGYVAGYYSPGLYGAAGIEQAWDGQLSGQRATSWDAWLDGLLHRTKRGHDVVLTVDPALQALGQRLLGDRAG
ncbi:MAG: hypothetical protein NZL87_07330, partial [Thermomicrobium sp.]|nr:hypothetical protein [Thermomicrobium sp.]